MKKVIILVFALSASFASFAQTDTSKIEQYCEIIATPRLFRNKVTIDIDFGEEKSFLKDEQLKTFDCKLKKFNTIIDVLNFMGRDGWVFINAYPIKMSNTEIYHFAFKKQIPKMEFQ